MILLYAFALLAGVLNTVMAGCNTTLAKKLQHPLAAAAVVSGVGMLAIIATALMTATFRTDLRWPTGTVRDVPWWAWTGGALGSVYVIAGLIVPARIGAASFTGMTVTAAILTSVAMDHFGIVGFKVHPAGIGRIIGAALMLAGLLLVVRF